VVTPAVKGFGGLFLRHPSEWETRKRRKYHSKKPLLSPKTCIFSLDEKYNRISTEPNTTLDEVFDLQMI